MPSLDKTTCRWLLGHPPCKIGKKTLVHINGFFFLWGFFLCLSQIFGTWQPKKKKKFHRFLIFKNKNSPTFLRKHFLKKKFATFWLSFLFGGKYLTFYNVWTFSKRLLLINVNSFMGHLSMMLHTKSIQKFNTICYLTKVSLWKL